MRPLRATTASVLLLAALAAPVGTQGVAPARTDAANFTVERVSPDVYALVRHDPPGLMFEANAAFVVRDSFVVVVDGGSNPESARAMLAAVRRTTRLPVRWLVNTHWHADHMLGNQVWAAAYPGVRIVAHETAREDFLGEGVPARRQFAEGAGRYADFLRDRVRKDSSLAGGALSADERESHLASGRLVDRALAQVSAWRETPPTVTFSDRLTLDAGARPIELRWLGRAHTRGDLVVWLPAERVVIAGDLVSQPAPLVGTTSFPIDFAATLDRLVALAPATWVLGHGPVLRDDAYPRLVARMLHALADGTRAAVARGETLEQARRSVDLSAYRDSIAGPGAVGRMLFDTYVRQPGVARAYWQATGER